MKSALPLKENREYFFQNAMEFTVYESEDYTVFLSNPVNYYVSKCSTSKEFTQV